jgi:hypothetical protein
VAKKGTTRNQSSSTKPPARREGVTLTAFQWWQVDSLVGIYAATPPEVLRRAALEWLQEHHTEIEQQKRDHDRFLSETRKLPSDHEKDLE